MSLIGVNNPTSCAYLRKVVHARSMRDSWRRIKMDSIITWLLVILITIATIITGLFTLIGIYILKMVMELYIKLKGEN